MGVETQGIGDPSRGSHSVDAGQIESFFREHRLSTDDDQEFFRRLRELPAILEEMKPDQLIELFDLLAYVSGRVPREEGTGRSFNRVIDNLNARAWETLKRLRPEEAGEIKGRPDMDSFVTASNRYATITRGTADVMKDVEWRERQRDALKKALRKKGLSSEDRDQLRADQEENEARLNALLAILEKRPREID